MPQFECMDTAGGLCCNAEQIHSSADAVWVCSLKHLTIAGELFYGEGDPTPCCGGLFWWLCFSSAVLAGNHSQFWHVAMALTVAM